MEEFQHRKLSFKSPHQAFPVELTDAAKSRMMEMIMRARVKADGVIGISLSVKKGRCAAWEYKFHYIYSVSEIDISTEITINDGNKFIFVVDPLALMAVNGAEIDYSGDELKSGFIFNNPNAKSNCGCGESFDV